MKVKIGDVVFDSNIEISFVPLSKIINSFSSVINMDKIWITRLTTFQIQCGGIDRLQVWFTEPHYTESVWYSEMDVPIGCERENGCYAKNGWEVCHGKTQQPVSFGGIFGYDSEISNFVWNKLLNHYGNTEFREWHNYESLNPECCIKNFMIELNLNVTLKL